MVACFTASSAVMFDVFSTEGSVKIFDVYGVSGGQSFSQCSSKHFLTSSKK